MTLSEWHKLYSQVQHQIKSAEDSQRKASDTLKELKAMQTALLNNPPAAEETSESLCSSENQAPAKPDTQTAGAGQTTASDPISYEPATALECLVHWIMFEEERLETPIPPRYFVFRHNETELLTETLI